MSRYTDICTFVGQFQIYLGGDSNTLTSIATANSDYHLYGICNHGDPFSNSPDGSALRCDAVSKNVCPSTHYCNSKPGQVEGICCVTKSTLDVVLSQFVVLL